MSKFKKGDKVCKAPNDSHMDLQFGKTYEVTDVLGNHVKILGCSRLGQPIWFKEKCFAFPYPNPPHKHAELIKAWADGAEVEVEDAITGVWRYTQFPNWSKASVYRIKPQPNPNAEKIAEIETTISQLQQQVKELKDGD